MIRFCCEQCGHRMGVPDQSAGKRGKCPKCGSVVMIPDKTATIKLHCENCGQKITVPKVYAGGTGRCPKCKKPVTVPGAKEPVHRLKQDEPADTGTRLVGNDIGLTLLDVPEELKLAESPVQQPEKIEDDIEQEMDEESDIKEPEPAGTRRLPWLLDIFLYPVSVPGLTHLAIFTIIPTLITILRTSLGRAGMVVGLPGFILNVLIGLYMGWYFTECVRDSAKGHTRAPEAFATAGLGEMWLQMQHLIGCYLIFLTPAFFYNLYTGHLDAVYWGLLVTGSFFFPMGLLACIMFDSIGGLNPILLLGSIFSTFFRYCGLVLLVVGAAFAVTCVAGLFGSEDGQVPTIATFMMMGVFYFLWLYLVFVIAHLIGRFYWRCQDKLNWEV